MDFILFFLFQILAFFLPAYLIGSIPNAVWIGKVFYGKDIRNEGSRNAGATNTIRVLGLKPGLCVLALDLLKGILPLALMSIYFHYPSQLDPTWNALDVEVKDFYTFFAYYAYYFHAFFVAIGTVLGHVFPIYVGFHGGKGVATLVGVLIMLYPQVFLIVAGVFFGVFFLSRYVSLSSMIAAISLPLLQFAFFQFDKLPLLIFAILIAIFVPLTHIKNIKRLIHSEEPKFVFKKHSTHDQPRP
ncbi:MAG: glycerol-3-phosphate 1-O-acyltransferase PlsY [Bacteroidales bacterium]|jgi:glycerol-3-phosphate acyltransferase PlsY|nr:glycerol-3-phosphate 1-O-acyltransferase PlsY [Bacteroidales bacterium]